MNKTPNQPKHMKNQHIIKKTIIDLKKPLYPKPLLNSIDRQRTIFGGISEQAKQKFNENKHKLERQLRKEQRKIRKEERKLEKNIKKEERQIKKEAKKVETFGPHGGGGGGRGGAPAGGGRVGPRVTGSVPGGTRIKPGGGYIPPAPGTGGYRRPPKVVVRNYYNDGYGWGGYGGGWWGDWSYPSIWPVEVPVEVPVVTDNSEQIKSDIKKEIKEELKQSKGSTGTADNQLLFVLGALGVGGLIYFLGKTSK